MSEQDGVETGISSVLLPLGPGYLLLPNTVVTEIISYNEPNQKAVFPNWVLGEMDWRDRRVPVICMERTMGIDLDLRNLKRARIVILNTINGNNQLPYIGLLTLGVSRLVRVGPDSLVADTDETLESPLLQAAVILANQQAWIPDLDELEQRVLEVYRHPVS